MEVLTLSCGGVPAFRFYDSTRKLPPPTTSSRRDPPLLPLKARSDLYSFGITCRIYSSFGYAFPLQAGAILSPFFRSRCRPEAVSGIGYPETGNTPNDDDALEKSPKTPVDNIRKEQIIAGSDRDLSQVLRPPYFLYPFSKKDFLYLIDLGLDPDQIKKMIRSYPNLPNAQGRTVELVEFLLDLGASRSGICKILYRFPNLCGCRIEENILPKMAFLNSLGVVHRSDIFKIMYRCPSLFRCRIQHLKETMSYFSELGVPAEKMSKMLIGFPQIFQLSLEKNLMPTTQFLLDSGFTNAEIATMASRFVCFYGYSLVKNLMPKCEFFFEMGYPRSDLVSFPQYFGYSLEDRIKPRYDLVRKHGVSLRLQSLVATSKDRFNRILEGKLKDKLSSTL